MIMTKQQSTREASRNLVEHSLLRHKSTEKAHKFLLQKVQWNKSTLNESYCSITCKEHPLEIWDPEMLCLPRKCISTHEEFCTVSIMGPRHLMLRNCFVFKINSRRVASIWQSVLYGRAPLF